jgi:hypothetical protein
MTTFGEFPGVKVETVGGGISSVRVGSEEKLVVFGSADLGTDAGSATPANAVGVSSRREVVDAFGQSELTQNILDAMANGANRDFVWGVALPDSDNISVSSSQLEVVFSVIRGDNQDDWDFLDGTASNTIDSDREITTAPTNVVNEGETGIFALIGATTGGNGRDLSTLESEVSAQRQDYRMVKGVAATPPNDGDLYNFSAFTSGGATTDASYMFEFAPNVKGVQSNGGYESLVGCVSGLFAGNSITNPVYNDALRAVDSTRQVVTRSDETTLRGENIIPVKEGATVRVTDNTSTSTDTDWIADFWRRRIVDRTILIAKQVGEAIIGRINDRQTRRAAERQIESQFRGLVRDRLLESNTGEDTSWYVNVEEDSTDPDRVNIDMGITPQGVVKRVDIQITIDT